MKVAEFHLPGFGKRDSQSPAVPEGLIDGRGHCQPGSISGMMSHLTQ